MGPGDPVIPTGKGVWVVVTGGARSEAFPLDGGPRMGYVVALWVLDVNPRVRQTLRIRSLECHKSAPTSWPAQECGRT